MNLKGDKIIKDCERLMNDCIKHSDKMLIEKIKLFKPKYSFLYNSHIQIFVAIVKGEISHNALPALRLMIARANTLTGDEEVDKETHEEVANALYKKFTSKAPPKKE